MSYNWQYNTDIEEAFREYVVNSVASAIFQFCKSVMDAKRSHLNFRYVDTSGATIMMYEDEEIEERGFEPYAEGKAFISGLGYDPVRDCYAELSEGLLWDLNLIPTRLTYDEKDSSPAIVNAVQNKVYDSYPRELFHYGMAQGMGGTGDDIWLDSDDNFIARAGAIQRLYQDAKKAMRLVKVWIKRRELEPVDADEIKGPTFYKVYNDYYGDIICELVGESDTAYYFQYKEGDTVLLPKWRVLKRSNRVKGSVSVSDKMNQITYYPGKEIQTESNQWFSVRELKTLITHIVNYTTGKVEINGVPEFAVNYGNGKVYINKNGDDSESTAPFMTAGVKGAYFKYNDKSGDLAGNAILISDKGELYDTVLDTPETIWTPGFKN